MTNTEVGSAFVPQIAASLQVCRAAGVLAFAAGELQAPVFARASSHRRGQSSP